MVCEDLRSERASGEKEKGFEEMPSNEPYKFPTKEKGIKKTVEEVDCLKEEVDKLGIEMKANTTALNELVPKLKQNV